MVMSAAGATPELRKKMREAYLEDIEEFKTKGYSDRDADILANHVIYHPRQGLGMANKYNIPVEEVQKVYKDYINRDR